MTKEQRRALVIIDRCISVNRIAPSLDELANGLGLKSKSGAKRLVDELVANGLLFRRPKASRALRLTADGHAALRPVVMDYVSTEALIAALARRGISVSPCAVTEAERAERLRHSVPGEIAAEVLAPLAGDRA